MLSRRRNPNLPVGARAIRGDLVTGEGVDGAVSGAEIIVHCATALPTAAASPGYRPRFSHGREPTRRILDAAKKSPTPARIVYPSIVGIDRIPLGYYRGKLDCERSIESSGLPYTIFRSTQWHTLGWEFGRRLTASPVVFVPKGAKSQLLDPDEVAERVAELIDTGVEGRAPDMGGTRFCDRYIVAAICGNAQAR